MVTALTILAVLIASMFLATMGAAMLAMHREQVEATERARSFFADYPPSSPSFALFRDGELVHLFPRHRIEGRDPRSIAADLREVFDRHCG